MGFLIRHKNGSSNKNSYPHNEQMEERKKNYEEKMNKSNELGFAFPSIHFGRR